MKPFRINSKSLRQNKILCYSGISTCVIKVVRDALQWWASNSEWWFPQWGGEEGRCDDGVDRGSARSIGRVLLHKADSGYTGVDYITLQAVVCGQSINFFIKIKHLKKCW